MRSVTFKSVLEGVAHLMGIISEQFPAEDKATYAEFINTAMETGWTWDFWPEWTTTEQRAYRDAWADGDYAAGAEVWHAATSKYWTALSGATTGEVPGTDAAWTELTTFARYVALDQPDQTPIGDVDAIFRNDPRVYPTRPGEMAFDITEQGIVPSPCAGNQIYVRFRRRVPTFTSVEWDADTEFAIGAVRYRPTTTGECYVALAANSNQVPENNPASWQKVDFPRVLMPYVKRAAYADALRADDQADKAMAEDRRAMQLLIDAQDRAFAGQSQYDSAHVSTY